MALHKILPFAFCLLSNVVSAVDDTSKEETGVTPVGKVIELLDVLVKQLGTDGKKDGNAYVVYTAWYHDESSNAERVIKDTNETIATLQTSIADQKSFQASETLKLEKTIGDLTQAENDLKQATEQREKEKAAFGEAESTLMNAVDSLDRSLVVLGKDASSAGSGLSLASVASNLRTTLLQSGDIAMTPSQRLVLDGFFRQARNSERAERSGAQSLMPDFLQVKSLRGVASGPYGDYESQSSGVVGTLQTVLDQTSSELSEARNTEKLAREQYTTFATALKDEIKNHEKTMSDTKTQIAQSEESTSQMEAQLAAAQTLLKVTVENLAEVEAQYVRKTEGYKERLKKRSDEIMAVREAAQLLTSDAAQRLMAADGGGSAESFFQVSQQGGGKFLRLLKNANSPAVALLALKMHTRRTRRMKADPFGKVKGLIQSMLEKLLGEANKEADKKAYCDKEMGESETSKKDKDDKLAKLGDRMSAMDAEIEQLTSDVTTVNEDLAEMRTGTSQAASARQEEKARNIKAIQQYKDGEKLIKTAIEVLQKFYHSEAAKAPEAGIEKEEEAYEAKSGLGNGVIGILEVALSDFADLHSELGISEAESAKEFKELSQESDIKAATFAKDLEYKTRNKVKLEGDRMRAAGDAKNYQNELDAVNVYLEKLKAECIGKAEAYEERKARREAELQSLREALEYLTGQ